MKKNLIPIIIFFTFFIAGLLTLKDYGINWDTINHLPRGQAYLHYFLTGNKSYDDLPAFKSYFLNPDILSSQTGQSRSYYQSSAADFNSFMQYDGYGHPPLSDILSSIFNRLLYGKLHIFNDIDSYRVYGILLAALLVGLIYFWVSKYYGSLAGILASISLALYPLFWSESHFNTEKDIPETVYWSFFIFFVWKGVVKKDIKWIIISGIIFGLALGTKFNILFSIIVIIPWLFSYLLINREKLISKFNLKLLISSIIVLVTGISMFIASWPYLWPDLVARSQTVIDFYKGIGVATGQPDPRFIGPLGTNTYPAFWIAVTTPPIILFLSIIGIFIAIRRSRKEKKQLSLLFLLWFLVPILRVSWHGANVYGGIRQIMEYLPAMAVLSGIGGSWIISKISQKVYFKLLAVIIIFVFLVGSLVKIHPNENVYFNFLVGGIDRAKELNIPSWGNTFGAAYRKGVSWINNNAPKKSIVATAYELLPNIPLIWFRQDLNIDNHQRSGPLMWGEYTITLTYQGTQDRSYYDSYLERFLMPVYQDKVDNTAILKVWKNDKEHLKPGYTGESTVTGVKVAKINDGLLFTLGDEYYITKLKADINNYKCQPLKYSYSEVSLDQVTWKRLPGTMPNEDWNTSAFGEQPQKNSLVIPYAAEPARYIKLIISPTDACLSKIRNLQIFALKSS